MRRSCLAGFLGLIALLASATPAAAQGWGLGIFAKWSGPGRFIGYPVRLPVGCHVPNSDDRGFYWFFEGRSPRGEQRDPSWCLDVEFAAYHNQEDDRERNGLVTFNNDQALIVATPNLLRRAVEGGVGFGVNRYFVNPSTHVVLAVIPLQGTLKPLRLFGWEKAGWLSVHGNISLFPKPISSDDLHTAQSFEDHHYQFGYGVSINLSQFLFRR